jgi:hypothetical protein
LRISVNFLYQRYLIDTLRSVPFNILKFSNNCTNEISSSNCGYDRVLLHISFKLRQRATLSTMVANSQRLNSRRTAWMRVFSATTPTVQPAAERRRRAAQPDGCGDGSCPPQAEGNVCCLLGRGGGDGCLHPQSLAHQGS